MGLLRKLLISTETHATTQVDFCRCDGSGMREYSANAARLAPPPGRVLGDDIRIQPRANTG
jgi:hypothetical protein